MDNQWVNECVVCEGLPEPHPQEWVNCIVHYEIILILCTMEYKLIENEDTGRIISEQTVKQFELKSADESTFFVRIVDNGDNYKFITDITGDWEDVEDPSELYEFIQEEIYGIY